MLTMQRKPQTVYCFQPRRSINKTVSPWVFAQLHKAGAARDALIAAGGQPTGIWSCTKDPTRALDCCFQRDGYTVRQVIRRINAVLRREVLLEGSDGLGCGVDRAVYDLVWSDQRGSRACFATTGTNEGHFVSLGFIYHGQWLHIAGAKVWNGMEHAQRIANRVAQLVAA